MLPDLERLIRLQQLDSEAEQRRRWTSDLPAHLAALDQRLVDRRTLLEKHRHALTENQTARRGLEKDLSAVQARLSKYKDQLMEVKTNKEYLAMQHEIAMAQDHVRAFEDQILELLVRADEIAADLKAAETSLEQEERAITAERGNLDAAGRRIAGELAGLASDRAAVERAMASDLLALFNTVTQKRGGSAVVAVRDGHCSACHVRLRPQFYNEIRRGDRIIQCESCSRILFYPPQQPTPVA
jgi:predicted  nucleic acid-binding Zn-ribbon protein